MDEFQSRYPQVALEAIECLESVGFKVKVESGAPAHTTYIKTTSSIDVELPESAGQTSAYSFEYDEVDVVYDKSSAQIYLECITKSVLSATEEDYILRKYLISDGNGEINYSGASIIGFNTSAFQGVSATNIQGAIEELFSSAAFISTGDGVVDHGKLQGLGDDDHPRYLSLSGRDTQKIDDSIQITGNTIISSASSPSALAKLDVDGKIAMRSGAVSGYIPVSDADGIMTWTNPAIISSSGTTVSGLTQGAVAFGGYDSTLFEDEEYFYYDIGYKRLGIRNNNPQYTLHLSLSADDDGISLSGDSAPLVRIDRQNTDAARIGMYDGGVEVIRLNSHANADSYIHNGGNFSIGTTAPDSKLHVHKATAGSVTSDSNSIVTIENSSHGFLQFLTPSSYQSGFYFGDPTSVTVGRLYYDHADDSFYLYTNSSLAFTVDSNQNVTLEQNLSISGSAFIDNYLDFTAIPEPSNPGSSKVRIYNVSEGGFDTLHYKDSSGLDHELTRDTIHIVRNASGSTISKGKVVYISGSNGTYPLISLARADVEDTMPAMGIVVSDIANNSFGQVMTNGDLRNIDTSSFSDGDELYVSTTVPGGLITTKPSGTGQVQYIGLVVKGGSVGAGIIHINMTDSQQSLSTSASPTFDGLTLTGGLSGTTSQFSGNLDAFSITMSDNDIHYFGNSNDVEMYFDGTNFVINPDAVGSGILDIDGSVSVLGNLSATNINVSDLTISGLTPDRVLVAGSGGDVNTDESIKWNSTSKRLTINRDVDGGWDALQITNPSTGTTAYTIVRIGEDSSTKHGFFRYYNASNTNTTGYAANGQFQIIANTASAGMAIGTWNTNPLIFVVNDKEVGNWEYGGTGDSRFSLNTASGGRWRLINQNLTGKLFFSHDSGGDTVIVTSAGNVGIGTSSPSHELDISKSKSGSSIINRIYNTSNTASSESVISLVVGGSLAGDPKISFVVNGVTDWRMGVDNSDLDKFKISASGALGTNDVISISTGRQVGILGGASAVLHVNSESGTVPSVISGTRTIIQENSSTSEDCRVAIIAGNAGSSVLDLGDADDQNDGSITYNHSTRTMAFVTANANRVWVGPLGYVGLGAEPTSARLESYTNNGFAGYFIDTTTNRSLAAPIVWIGTPSDTVQGNGIGMFGIGDNSDTSKLGTLFRVTQKGSVGLGQTSPTARLDVAGVARITNNSFAETATGTGTEIEYNNSLSRGRLTAYDRTNLQWKGMQITGSTVALAVGIDPSSTNEVLKIENDGEIYFCYDNNRELFLNVSTGVNLSANGNIDLETPSGYEIKFNEYTYIGSAGNFYNQIPATSTIPAATLGELTTTAAPGSKTYLVRIGIHNSANYNAFEVYNHSSGVVFSVSKDGLINSGSVTYFRAVSASEYIGASGVIFTRTGVQVRSNTYTSNLCELFWNTSTSLMMNLNSASQTLNLYTGKMSIGSLQDAAFPFDVTSVTGNTHAIFGTNRPITIISNSPNIGFNSYYETNWKYARNSSSMHGGYLGFDTTEGRFTFGISSATGNAGASASMLGAVHITNTGIGVGTTPGTNTLHLSATSGSVTFKQELLSNGSWTSTQSSLGTTWNIAGSGTKNLYVQIGGAEKLRVDANGIRIPDGMYLNWGTGTPMSIQGDSAGLTYDLYYTAEGHYFTGIVDMDDLSVPLVYIGDTLTVDKIKGLTQEYPTAGSTLNVDKSVVVLTGTDSTAIDLAAGDLTDGIVIVVNKRPSNITLNWEDVNGNSTGAIVGSGRHLMLYAISSQFAYEF